MTTPTHDSDAGHLDPVLLATYAEGRVTAAERALVETHLADCADCRSQVAAARSAPAATRPIGRVAGWAIAAAVIGLVLYSSSRRNELLHETRIERGALAVEQTRLTPASPALGTSVRADSVVFSWRAQGDIVSYRLMVLAEDGTTIWSVVTSDTSLRLPVDRHLTPGREYFWIVDGLLKDGKSATTGSIKFAARSP